MMAPEDLEEEEEEESKFYLIFFNTGKFLILLFLGFLLSIAFSSISMRIEVKSRNILLFRQRAERMYTFRERIFQGQFMRMYVDIQNSLSQRREREKRNKIDFNWALLLREKFT